jgi:DNA-binding GntR family transcriptional regulator
VDASFWRAAGSIRAVTISGSPTRAGSVYDAIREEILTAGIPPGTKMKLADYSERFDVSLSVVREAMGRLAEQNLLQANPQRGFSTLSLSIDDLVELSRARIIIETATLRESVIHGSLEWEVSLVGAHHKLAATPMYLDGALNPGFGPVHRDFHAALLAGSSNAHLQSIAASLRDRSELYMFWSRTLGEPVDRDVACEHRELTELTLARQADAAADALSGHIQRTTDILIDYASKHFRAE